MILSESKNKGFTIIEMIVVVGIIGILVSIVLFSVLGARMQSRDMVRISDLENIQLGLRLYKDASGSYPEYAFDIDATISDPILQEFIGDFLGDPLNETGYYYRYEPTANCTSGSNNQKVLYARTMEKPSKSNYSEVCTCVNECGYDGGYVPDGGYVILIGK